MLLFNLDAFQYDSIQGSLNTYHVIVQQSNELAEEINLISLNTSYVSVQLSWSAIPRI